MSITSRHYTFYADREICQHITTWLSGELISTKDHIVNDLSREVELRYPDKQLHELHMQFAVLAEVRRAYSIHDALCRLNADPWDSLEVSPHLRELRAFVEDFVRGNPGISRLIAPYVRWLSTAIAQTTGLLFLRDELTGFDWREVPPAARESVIRFVADRRQTFEDLRMNLWANGEAVLSETDQSSPDHLTWASLMGICDTFKVHGHNVAIRLIEPGLSSTPVEEPKPAEAGSSTDTTPSYVNNAVRDTWGLSPPLIPMSPVWVPPPTPPGGYMFEAVTPIADSDGE
ncbi:hypothetical protein PENSPDRAFT_660026 [Peniophora sp. CONT]|nr:hypothetical protein PENSPDRAFT_660026 [Peniophora sp. CONT]